MHTYLIDLLQCPSCGGELTWDVITGDDERIEEADVLCSVGEHTYHVRGGIGHFLVSDLDREDLWEESRSGLSEYLEQNPDVYEELMETSVEALAPADLFYRALIMEERGDYIGGLQLEKVALEGLYLNEYRECSDKMIEYVINQLDGAAGPVVDIASGRGYLVTRMADELEISVVATDFSPRVLRHDRMRLEALGLYSRVSLLVLDARRTPFKDRALPVVSSYLGVQNIQHPSGVYAELRRILKGKMFLISHFYPEGDGNAEVIRRFDMDDLLYKVKAIPQMRGSGFRVMEKNVCRANAVPTPTGKLLEGALIDGLPIERTKLEWCVLEVS